MRDMGVVCGSEAQAKPVVIGKDTVYVHTNIKEIDEIDEVTGERITGVYTYNEVQYTLEEYEQLQREQQQQAADKENEAEEE